MYVPNAVDEWGTDPISVEYFKQIAVRYPVECIFEVQREHTMFFLLSAYAMESHPVATASRSVYPGITQYCVYVS